MRHASLVSLEKMGSEERQKLLILLSIYEVRNIANNREEEKTITQTIRNIKYNVVKNKVSTLYQEK
ncbi:hypothetical protein [Cyanobacterium aponinum]|uniref:hypothetical protein n=1 Tax=Cyanobacterium aponinum TaxID=379064 RepID=UPI0010568D33|nr:hypothetical protein [Cyanobacterium aponinum]